MERHRRSVIHAFASIIQAQAELLAADGKIERRWNYELAGVALAGGVNELIADWLFRRDRPRIPKFAGEIVLFFLAVLQAGSASPRPLRRAR
jgi:hypothetical protein